MTALIQKKKLEIKRNTTESVEIVQCDSTTNKTSASNQKVQKPSETNTEDSMIVELTNHSLPSVIPQLDGPLEINVTDGTTQISHINTNDESRQPDDTNKPKPYKGLGGFDYYTLNCDDP